MQSALERVETQSLNDDGYKFLIASLNFENKQLKEAVASKKIVEQSVKYQTSQENTLAPNSPHSKEKAGIYKINKRVINSQSLKDESIEYQLHQEIKPAANSQSLREKSAKYEIIQIVIYILLLLILFNEGTVKWIMMFAAIQLYFILI
ncbi:hypothetical protein NIES4071_86750 [Calothrix sp. NIES-4071]|nr:hypothetical protein NIES4071_86750 [Calothrix sp. NIES-4071]BAZ62942.1 hypothetical protein NIES4105_86680 [Calothrix sp. NIES-4105]